MLVLSRYFCYSCFYISMKAGICMSFWQKFKALVPLRHILFLLALFAVTLVIFYFDSSEDIKISFSEESVTAKASNFQMDIPYEMIGSAELVSMEEGGSKITGSDNMVTRLGTWENEAWGEYSICADLDAQNCIKVNLDDGRIFIFSRKNDEETASIYAELLSHLQAN